MARIVAADEALEEAAQAVLAGEVVAVPTETVYGLAADATRGDAVARIYEAKGRPRFNPLIAHVDTMAMAESVGIFDPLSRRLAELFWPGPLTLVIPLATDASVAPLMTAGLDTVAVRMPRGFAARLIARVGRPLAAPSANSSGRLSGTTAAAVDADLGRRIPLVVDGGRTLIGVESTIIKIEGDRAILLRPGGVPTSDIERELGSALERNHGGAIEAPGMMASHYAPEARLRLDADAVRAGEALLAFGPVRAADAHLAEAVLNLSETGDLREAAANLFEHLQALDATGVRVIAAEPVPHDGLGEAINDRLARAAAPRSVAAGRAAP